MAARRPRRAYRRHPSATLRVTVDGVGRQEPMPRYEIIIYWSQATRPLSPKSPNFRAVPPRKDLRGSSRQRRHHHSGMDRNRQGLGRRHNFVAVKLHPHTQPTVRGTDRPYMNHVTHTNPVACGRAGDLLRHLKEELNPRFVSKYIPPAERLTDSVPCPGAVEFRTETLSGIARLRRSVRRRSIGYMEDNPQE